MAAAPHSYWYHAILRHDTTSLFGEIIFESVPGAECYYTILGYTILYFQTVTLCFGILYRKFMSLFVDM